MRSKPHRGGYAKDTGTGSGCNRSFYLVPRFISPDHLVITWDLFIFSIENADQGRTSICGGQCVNDDSSQGQNWDSNSDVYSQNEENMIKWEGHMIEPNHRTCIMLKDLTEADALIIASVSICASESKIIDATIDLHKMNPTLSEFDDCIIANCSHAVLSRISSIYDPIRLHDLLLERRNDGVFAASIGSTNFGSSSNYISEVTNFDSDEKSESEPDDNNDATITDWD